VVDLTPALNISEGTKVKLFKTKEIPSARKPDYDFISKAEKEFRIDDEGFNERFDEALINDYKARKNASNWTTEERLREVERLSSQLTSFRWKMVAVNQTVRIESQLRDERHGPGFDAACKALRSRMMLPRSINR